MPWEFSPMEICEWATRVFAADTLDEKLLVPPGGLKSLTDRNPGPAVLWRRPPRPSHLQIAPKDRRKGFPKVTSLHREEMRARCLHTFANHELMALEMMAWALLAFPEADSAFRRGLAQILLDEQRHFQLYAQRLEGMGVTFGDFPINDHFWRAGPDISSPLNWVCTMHLTFEQSNLDHAPYFGKLFQEVDDQASAQLMQTIFEDEIRHVRFGSRWLKKYTDPDTSTFQAFTRHCHPMNPPERAMGPEFQVQARLQAGLDEDFVTALRESAGP